jgi:hypothetical protein
MKSDTETTWKSIGRLAAGLSQKLAVKRAKGGAS